MVENHLADKEPLWMLIEKQIEEMPDSDFDQAKVWETAAQIAEKLDKTGYNVSKSGGNWQQLKTALNARIKAEKPFLQDFNKALANLELDGLSDTTGTAMQILSQLGKDWPVFGASENREDVLEIVEKRKVDLMIAKAKSLPEEAGIRYLISESFEPERIVEALGITENAYKTTKEKVDAELAEKARAGELLKAVAKDPEPAKVKHLINNNVADGLITEITGSQQSVIDEVKKAMEKELAEKKRLEEELAAKKAAEAAGPALDDISDDDMLEYIEGLREILDFADSEKDIRAMSEQSSIPKSLVDIAVSDPDKLDELEEKAGG